MAEGDDVDAGTLRQVDADVVGGLAEHRTDGSVDVIGPDLEDAPATDEPGVGGRDGLEEGGLLGMTHCAESFMWSGWSRVTLREDAPLRSRRSCESMPTVHGGISWRSEPPCAS